MVVHFIPAHRVVALLESLTGARPSVGFVHGMIARAAGLLDATHQLCCAHILRDLEDAAQTYPDAHWPTQIQDALRELIHYANLARESGHQAIPAHVTDRLISLFRHGVRVGLSQVRRVPGPKSRTKQPIGRVLLEVLGDREDDVLRFVGDLRVPPLTG